MQTKHTLRLISLILGIILVIGLTACTLSASKGPSGLTTLPVGDFPLPEETNPFQPAATETKAAEGQVVVVPAFTATPVVEQQVAPAAPAVVPTEIPLPKATEGKPPATYTIQKGEHPFCIARRFNVNQSEMLSLNGLGLNSKVSVGFILKIPQTGNPFVTDRALKAHPAQYTVQSGDTIYTIACAFGDVSPDMIALANGLQSPYNLSTGQVLKIP